MVFTVPGSTVSLLTKTGKMPSRSFSLPALRSCPSAVTGPNSICGSCYATRKVYTFPCVKNAQEARFLWTIKAASNNNEGWKWICLMVDAINSEVLRQHRKHKKEGKNDSNFQAVFRIHDSGDLFSPAYAKLWRVVCWATPHVKYWIPTRQWISKNPHMVRELEKLAALPNVAVRPSTLYFEDEAPEIPLLSAGTTASSESYNCPAPENNNKCGDCRNCWDKHKQITYKRH